LKFEQENVLYLGRKSNVDERSRKSSSEEEVGEMG
jgi:hypothetical protein